SNANPSGRDQAALLVPREGFFHDARIEAAPCTSRRGACRLVDAWRVGQREEYAARADAAGRTGPNSAPFPPKTVLSRERRPAADPRARTSAEAQGQLQGMR